jgi:hypothetical protein
MAYWQAGEEVGGVGNTGTILRFGVRSKISRSQTRYGRDKPGLLKSVVSGIRTNLPRPSEIILIRNVVADQDAAIDVEGDAGTHARAVAGQE